MKAKLFVTIVLAAVLLTDATAQSTPIFPKGEKSEPVHHVGNVWLSELSGADSVFTYNISQAIFDPGARLDWHMHPGGQILLITEGVGYYQERGKLKQTVRKGDVIKCAPGVEHWHGATPESGVTYLATSPVQKGRTIWRQKVSVEDYSGAK
jgi:quercetin dioxygenase-like cupin family protein